MKHLQTGNWFVDAEAPPLCRQPLKFRFSGCIVASESPLCDFLIPKNVKDSWKVNRIVFGESTCRWNCPADFTHVTTHDPTSYGVHVSASLKCRALFGVCGSSSRSRNAVFKSHPKSTFLRGGGNRSDRVNISRRNTSETQYLFYRKEEKTIRSEWKVVLKIEFLCVWGE